MSTQSRILVYGHDLILLETRSWMLAKAGFLVERASSRVEVERLMAEHRPEVLLLCYTLPDGECVAMKEIVTRAGPEMKVLVLTTQISGCRELADAFVLSVPTDPTSLIRAVQRLTQRDDLQRSIAREA